MEEKKFYCKAGYVPMAFRMALKSWHKDQETFKTYAPGVFTDNFEDGIETKIVNFEHLLKAADVRKQQKSVTVLSIPAILKELQLLLNNIEGYLNLAGTALDMQMNDFGLDKVRTAIHDKEVATVVATSNSLLVHLQRRANNAVLTAKGMKADMLTTFAAKVTELQNLKNEQNELKNKTGRVASSNIAEANELWDILTTICDAGVALYKGVDSVKLREYTISAILKRIRNPQTGSEETPEAAAK